MNKGLYFVAFVVGAGIGGFAAWKYAQKKYEQIAQEEIDSVKETFAKREKELCEKAEELESAKKAMAEQAKDKPSVMEYASRVSAAGYTNYCKDDFVDHNKPLSDAEPVDYHHPQDKPYVISPDEYGEFDDYNKHSLTYYADKFLADDNDDLVDDVEEIIGWESLNHFGDYEDDSVFVRNDRLKCDYEILLSLRNYSEVAKRKIRTESYQIEED